jgi:hypothetical protein
MELSGLVGEDAVAWASRHGASLVDFSATRGARMTPRGWLEAVASMDGRGKRDGAALADTMLRKSGLAAYANAPFSSLNPYSRAAVAVAEQAVALSGVAGATVVLPEPPLPWPERHELRRLAIELLAGSKVVIHARDAAELAPLMPRDSIVEAGVALQNREGERSMILRVYGWGEPYEALRAALEALDVKIAGGPIAHVLTAPTAITPREVLAAAFDAGIDVLEVRTV